MFLGFGHALDALTHCLSRGPICKFSVVGGQVFCEMVVVGVGVHDFQVTLPHDVCVFGRTHSDLEETFNLVGSVFSIEQVTFCRAIESTYLKYKQAASDYGADLTSPDYALSPVLLTPWDATLHVVGRHHQDSPGDLDAYTFVSILEELWSIPRLTQRREETQSTLDADQIALKGLVNDIRHNHNIGRLQKILEGFLI